MTRFGKKFLQFKVCFLRFCDKYNSKLTPPFFLIFNQFTYSSFHFFTIFIFSLCYILKIILFQKGVVVLCGSSYKNIGVQKLLDAVVNILPSPGTRKDLDNYNAFGDNLCASAFKVVHEKRKGPITFFRIYSGSMKKVNLQKKSVRSLIEPCRNYK